MREPEKQKTFVSTSEISYHKSSPESAQNPNLFKKLPKKLPKRGGSGGSVRLPVLQSWNYWSICI